MFWFLGIIILLCGLAMIAGAITAHRDNPRAMFVGALPGLALVAIWFLLGHGLPDVAWGGVLQGYLLLSVIAASGMQIAKVIGRVEAIPRFGLVLSGIDALALDMATGGNHMGLAQVGSLLWALGFFAWIIGLVATAFGAPVLSRRRKEADAEIARLRHAETTSAEGEGW